MLPFLFHVQKTQWIMHPVTMPSTSRIQLTIDSKCTPACARKRNFEKCPEPPALSVGVMKTAGRRTFCSTGTHSYDLESNLQTTTERIINDVNCKHDPSPPGAPGDAGENLSGVLGRARNGKVAATERIHRQGSSSGCESRWHLQDVVHQFQHRQGPLLRRNLSRIEASRTHLL